MARRGQRDRRKERFWRQVLRQWRRSGQSVRAFCAAQGLTEPSFYFWRRTLTQRQQARRQPRPASESARRPRLHDGDSPDGGQPTFVPVRVLAPAAALEVVLGCGRVIRVPADFDAATLRQLLVLLEQTPPC